MQQEAGRRIVNVVIGKRQSHHEQQRQQQDKDDHEKTRTYKQVRKAAVPSGVETFADGCNLPSLSDFDGILAGIDQIK
ncbi:hypothetical protein D3C71_1281020 [compost metagenome]